jgi:ribosomal protein S21
MVKVTLQGDLENLYRMDRDKGLRAMLAIFKKACMNADIITECKRREFYESPGEKRRRKKQESIRERKKSQAKAKREQGL